MNRALILRAALVFAAYPLAGCALAPDRDPGQGVALGDSFAPPEPSLPDADADQQRIASQDGWWRLYEDETLNALMARAFADNPGLLQVRARFVQAQAQAMAVGAPLFPTLGVTGERADSRGDTRTDADFTLRGASSYELDIWGKNLADLKSSSLQAESSGETLRAAAVTLSGTLTETWLRLLAAREEEALLRKQIEINQTILDLQKKRFSMGNAGALDVLQQTQALARAKAQMPDILSTQDQLLHQLAILIGQSPSAPLDIVANALPDVLPLPDAGIPSSLLGERPDIAAAWLRMRSADWAAESAWAERLPAFSLTANYTTSAGLLDGLFNTWLLDMAANVVLPLVDGGARRAEEMRSRALADEYFQAYRETVLAAVDEVEDALSLNYYQAQELEALDVQYETARNTLRQAQVSYANGDQDYINVLDALDTLQSLEQQIVQERLMLHLNRVALYRALGGRSWSGFVLQGDAPQNKPPGEQYL